MNTIEVSNTSESLTSYIEARHDLAGLSPVEIVHLARTLHNEWQASPERKAEIQAARTEREQAAKAKAAERAQARAERDAADRERLLRALAKIDERDELRNEA